MARLREAFSPEDIAGADDDRYLRSEFADLDDSLGNRLEGKAVNPELPRPAKTLARQFQKNAMVSLNLPI